MTNPRSHLDEQNGTEGEVTGIHADQAQLSDTAEEDRLATLLERIRIDPKLCFGKPCIKRTRIWESLVPD